MRLIWKPNASLKSAYERCKQILIENKESLDLVAKTLLEIETLDAEQIKSLINEGKLPENHHMTKKLSNNSEKETESDVKVNIHSKKDEEEATAESDQAPTEESPSKEDTPRKKDE